MDRARLLVGSMAFCLWAVSSNAASITPDEAVGLRPLMPSAAASQVGKTARVCGVVASTKYDAHLRSQPTFLRLREVTALRQIRRLALPIARRVA